MDKLILIAGDEPKTLQIIRNLLLYNGYPLVVAHTSEAAIRAALECKPDLILIDLHESGLEAARILKKRAATKSIPLLILGMSIPKGEARKYQNFPWSELATNSLHLPSLLETIRRALASPPEQASVPQVRPSVKRSISHMAIPAA